MDTLQDVLEIVKDLLEILVLDITARQLLGNKKKKSNKSKKKK